MLNEPKKGWKVIITADGGGYMGVISGEFFKALEDRTGRRIYEIADMLSGTSTGAIQMGCFAAGVPASVVQELYLTKEKTAFTRDYWPWRPKYKKEPLVNLLKNMITHYGKDDMQQCKTKLQINAVDLCGSPSPNTFFKSWKPKCRMPISTAAKYSFSAANYFGSSVDKQNKKIYGDGGTGNANCTLLYAMIEAEKLGWMDTGVYIISVGTGFSDTAVDFAEGLTKRGKIWEIRKFMNMARRQSVNMQLKLAQEQCKKNRNFAFTRVNVEIPEMYQGLDKLKNKMIYKIYGGHMVIDYTWVVLQNLEKIF